MTEAARAYLYRISFAVIAVVGAYGYFTDTEAALTGSLVAAILPAGVSVLNSKVTSEGIRTYLYGIALAALPILNYYGVVEESMTPQIIVLLGALFATGVAAANTSTE